MEADVGDQPVYLERLHRHEVGCARRIRDLQEAKAAALHPDPEAALERYEADAGIRLSATQRQAVLAALTHKVLIITGGPGTGKTTLVRGIVRLAELRRRRVVLGAPTGRAAKRLAEATRRAVRAWGLEILCVNPTEYSASLTAVLIPDGHDADALRRIVLERFNMSLGQGLGKVSGKIFRIGHLGWFNELMLCGTLAGVEMGLALAGVPHRKGGVEDVTFPHGFGSSGKRTVEDPPPHDNADSKGEVRQEFRKTKEDSPRNTQNTRKRILIRSFLLSAYSVYSVV